MKRSEIKIYTAGKTWAAHWFRPLEKLGFTITAAWIHIQDVLANAQDEFAPEIHEDEAYKREIWDNGCKIDCATADVMVMACHPDDGNNHSGSLVELGHVTGAGKPAYILGTCQSVEPIGNSDRAWKSQAIVHHWPEYDVSDPAQMLEAFKRVIKHYRKNYSTQWLARNGTQSAIQATR